MPKEKNLKTIISVISQLIKEAKEEKKTLQAVWLDLANANGSICYTQADQVGDGAVP